MSFTTQDKEARKFETDPADSSKVVVKTKVENTDSDAVPVKIINTDANIDVEVSVPSTISIDDSTPIDVNVTTSPISVNSTIQGTPSVNATISGTPNVTVSNSSLNTNATIQNSELDVNVTNMHINVYDMIYDYGASQWRFQASDSNGKAINLDHTYYESTEITALGSSTDINLWLSAYNDSMLQYKYVGSYDDEFEVEVYYTHPSLGDGNKCLKLVFDYSTQNSKKVVQSVFASVVNWSFDSSVAGTLAVTLGTITSPDPNSAIAVGTDICTVAVSNTTQGSITISLSGTNASLYRLHNVTDGVTGSSIAYDAAKSFVLETNSDFSGADYSHSLTVTATNDFYGNTATANVATAGTHTGVSFSNAKYLAITRTGGAQNGYVEGETISHDFTTSFSMSFWVKMAPLNTGYQNAYHWGARRGTTTDSVNRYDVHFQYRGNVNNYIFIGGAYSKFPDPTLDDNNFHNVIITWDGSGLSGTDTISDTEIRNNYAMYVDGSALTLTAGGGTASLTASATFTNFRAGDFVIGYPCPTHQIDEWAVWHSTKLTSTEAGLIYNGGTITDLENTTGVTVPTRYWRYEDSSNLTRDTISDSNQGTISNGTSTSY